MQGFWTILPSTLAPEYTFRVFSSRDCHLFFFFSKPYLFQEKFSQAIEYLEPGLAIARQVGDRLSQKRALLNLATAHLNIGNLDKTTQFAQELLAFAEKEKDLVLKAAALQGLGAAEFARKNYGQAIRYHEQSWKITQQLKDPEREAIILQALGEAYIAAGDPKKGASYLEQSRAISQRHQQGAGKDQLTIQPNDSWNIVVAKAISLRQLGRINEAVSAFARYGEMFATEPTTKPYSRIAQQFTKQIKTLGVDGGVYIYELVNGGAASQAGLAVGDIVIKYNGQPIRNMNDLVTVRDSAPKGKPLEVICLRLGADNQFRRRNATVSNPMGSGFMPI